MAHSRQLTPGQLWQIWSRTPFGTSKDFQEQIRLRREVVRMKRELNQISAQDDFARWAKLRRQVDKATEEHDKKGEHTSHSPMESHTDGIQPPQLAQRAHPSILRRPCFDGLARAVSSLLYNSGMGRHLSTHTHASGSHGQSSSYLAFHDVHTEACQSTSGATPAPL